MDSKIEKTLKSDRIYEGKIINLRVDTVELPDKKYSKREIVEHQKAVGIIAFDGKDRIWMVRQYRKALDKMTLEIPAGLIEPNELPADAAKRELQEEVGYTCENINYLFDTYSSPGFTNEKMSLFLAEDLKESKLENDEDEFVYRESFEVDELYNMILNCELSDAKTIIAVLVAKKYMEESKL
ncbi:MAG: NUDIX hydrolase [Tissierellia bacterium]|nr:NUDIX hydrolase [Tissierellia bacterium]